MATNASSIGQQWDGHAIMLSTARRFVIAEFMDQVMTLSKEYGQKCGLFRVWIANHVIVMATKADTAEV